MRLYNNDPIVGSMASNFPRGLYIFLRLCIIKPTGTLLEKRNVGVRIQTQDNLAESVNVAIVHYQPQMKV